MKKKQTSRTLYYLITAVAIVTFWRGCWGLLDHYLLPENELLSYWLSLIIGLLVLYFNDKSFTEISGE